MLLAHVAPTQARTMLAADFTGMPNIQAIQRRGYWRWGVSADMAPFAYKDPITGAFRGLEVDIAKQMTTALFGGRPSDIASHIEFVEVGFGQRLTTLVDNRVDSVIDIFADTAERRRDISFAGCYMSGKPAVIALDDHAEVFDVSDLNGTRVAVLHGSSAIAELEMRAPNAEIIAMASANECVAAVKDSSVNVFWGSKAENHLFVIAENSGLQQFALNVSAEPWKIAVRKDAADLRSFINNEIAEMICSGTLAATMNRWFRGIAV